MTRAVSLSLPAARERQRVAATAAVLGVLLVWLVGFSPLPRLHEAAHDTRHAMAFPCH